jgi:hypothetical protein
MSATLPSKLLHQLCLSDSQLKAWHMIDIKEICKRNHICLFNEFFLNTEGTTPCCHCHTNWWIVVAYLELLSG